MVVPPVFRFLFDVSDKTVALRISYTVESSWLHMYSAADHLGNFIDSTLIDAVMDFKTALIILAMFAVVICIVKSL